MNSLFCAAVALNLTPLDWDGNLLKIESALQHFRRLADEQTGPGHIGILCLPALSLCGPGCEDMFLSQWVCDQAFDLLEMLIPKTNGLLVSVGLPVRYADKTYKGTALIANGKLLGISCSSRIAHCGIHYDGRWFSPWTGPPVQTTLYGRDLLLGESSYSFEGTTIGVCDLDDLREKEYSSPLTASDVLLCPSCDPFELENDRTRYELLVNRSREYANTILFANPVGNESGCVLYDGGCLVASSGKLLARNRRFSYNDVELAAAIVQIENQNTLPVNCTAPANIIEDWELSSQLPFEEFARAVPLAMFDYMRKCQALGFALSLSGGADSASIALMIRLLVHFGMKYPEFLEKIKYIPSLADVCPFPDSTKERKLVELLLVTAYQGTRNSSKVTRHAAEEIARAIGSRHYELNIDPVVEEYESMIAKLIGRKLDWQTDDLALQNIQARTRAPGIWLLANLESRLLLSTGNRSEAACGYATMDGDTCGALSPIGGIDKAFLREWLKWMESTGPKTFGPTPALKLINEQQPTAELRPAESHQTDEGDLMPYPVLNLFETLLIRDRLDCETALRNAIQEGTSLGWTFSTEEYSNWLNLFCRRWSLSQWKRLRSAPAFHLDGHNLSPVSWCRFPILSGGFPIKKGCK